MHSLRLEYLSKPAADAAGRRGDEDPLTPRGGVGVGDEGDGREALEEGGAGVFGLDAFGDLEDFVARHGGEFGVSLRSYPDHPIAHGQSTRLLARTELYDFAGSFAAED